MKRTFIAFDITPSDNVRQVYETLRHKLRNERISWTDPDHFHITLKFLGDTTEENIPKVINSLESIIRSFVPFKVLLRGIGVFRNIHDPHVLWMGCSIGKDLSDFQGKLDRAVSEYGFKAENRPFSPHLTLGRIKLIRQTNTLGELLTTFKEQEFQAFTVDELVFYESRLTPSGAVYSPIEKFTIPPSQS